MKTLKVSNSKKAENKIDGYTLVEVLVVIAFISIFSILSFSGNSWRKQSLARSQCQNNLHSIFIAWQSYTQDNDGIFPNIKRWSKAISPYINSESTFSCPGVSQNQFGKDPILNYGVYPGRVSNIRIINGKWRGIGALEASVSKEDQWILMTDAGGGSTEDMQSVIYPPQCAYELFGVHTLGRDFPILHNGGGNYLFADGHTKWLTPQEGVQTDCAAGPFISKISNITGK